MHIISRKMLREFWKEHKDAEEPLKNWFMTASKASWQNLAEIKVNFPHADSVGRCTVFNIGGNKYRLVVKIEFLKQKIFTKFVLTHKEYDKDKWKTEC